MTACQTGMGPLASLLMSIGGALLYSRDRRRLWALALAASAASRFLMPAAYVGARLLFLLERRTYAAHPVFDEHDFAVALGLPPLLVTGAAALFLFGLAFRLLRQTEKGRRVAFALALIAGIAAGMTVWIAITPSILLSYPGR